MPLKGISPLISPELLYAIARMGHGDEILLADCHFPATSIAAASNGQTPILIRADGHSIPKLLEAILALINLDTYVPYPVHVMGLVEEDKKKGLPVEVWETYTKIIFENTKRHFLLNTLERFKFYDRAKQAFIVVQTGETAQYGNIILTNGLVLPKE